MERRKPKKESNDNPFSFRNFLTTSSNNTDPSTSSTINHSHISSNRTQNLNNLNTNLFSNRRRDVSDRVSNPYSFARFIQNPESCRPIPGELPDFVQDHFSPSNGLGGEHGPRNGLPDFTHHTHQSLDSTLQTQGGTQADRSLPFYGRSHGHGHGQEYALAPVSDSSSDESATGSPGMGGAMPSLELPPPRLAGSTSANLPDFLSDTGISLGTAGGTSGTSGKDSTDAVLMPLGDSIYSSGVGHASTSDGHNHEPGEDIVLSARIMELEEELSQKSTKIRQLEQQLNEHKRKEEEETEIMESMMRQVDENLERAVERWKNSEREVERLNAKVHQLEIQLSRVSSDSSHAPMHIVRHIGAQLGSDLIAADEIMKRFLEHSDKLKMLAGHLQYLDRVEDVTQSDSERTNPS